MIKLAGQFNEGVFDGLALDIPGTPLHTALKARGKLKDLLWSEMGHKLGDISDKVIKSLNVTSLCRNKQKQQRSHCRHKVTVGCRVRIRRVQSVQHSLQGGPRRQCPSGRLAIHR